MFGLRVLLYLLGIALVIWILFRLAKKPRIEKQPDKQVDDMVQCAHCGTYTPRHAAVREGEKYYCCTEHRDEDR